MHSSSLLPSQEEVDVKRTLEPQLNYQQEDEERQDGDSTGDSTTAVSSLLSMTNRTCISKGYCTVYMSYTWSAPCRSILIRAHKCTMLHTQIFLADSTLCNEKCMYGSSGYVAITTLLHILIALLTAFEVLKHVQNFR